MKILFIINFTTKNLSIKDSFEMDPYKKITFEMDPYRKITKKFIRKFDSKAINRNS